MVCACGSSGTYLVSDIYLIYDISTCDYAINKAIEQVFQPFGTKHALCLWHLFKNITKNICGTLGSKWAEFIKTFYKCLDKYDEDNFKIQ